MYGRQGNSSNTQPPPWLVRAEVTIRHGTPVTSQSGQVPASMSSTVTDSNGVRMVYRWNTSQSPSTRNPISTSAPSATSAPAAAPSSSFGFQRGNILFTSTPPPRPIPGSFTIPRSRPSANDDPVSSRVRGINVTDSGYNSEQFSPQSYSSLPSRRPSQQYNRRCKSTCSIVLSTHGTSDNTKKETSEKVTTAESSKYSYEESFRHRPAHQHVFSRYQFSTVPEVCEDCIDGNSSSAFTTHFCTRLHEKAVNKTASSKDASSQTTDIESRSSSSTITKNNKIRRKAAPGLHNTDEQKKKKQDNELSTIPSGTTSSEPPIDSEKSDSSAKDDSAKRKSRTVHIDVYCTGSDDNTSTTSSSENECGTPLTVFENPDVKVTHTQAGSNVLPRGFQDDKAFLKRATERRCDSFKNAPMRMPSLASSKGYDSDDVLSSLYPSQFSSYSALRDLDSTPWSAASSNAAIPFDYDSTIATSSKDTFSDIESLVNSKTSLTPCDSFEYANSSDRERIRKMEQVWKNAEKEKKKNCPSPKVNDGKYLFQNKKMREYLEKHDMGWSSGDSGDDSDESGAIGWSFVSSDESQLAFKRNLSDRRLSKEKSESMRDIASSVSEIESQHKILREEHSDSTTRSELTSHTYALRDRIGPFGSKSPSPLPSKVPSRVTSPFTTPQGERTEHIIKASIFGTVVNAFRKPGHHVGPSKNPSCSCEHCRRYFEEEVPRGRSRSMSEFERRPGHRSQIEKDIIRPAPTNSRH